MKYILITIIVGLTIQGNTNTKKTPTMAHCLVREHTGKNECYFCNKGYYNEKGECKLVEPKLDNCLYYGNDKTKCFACGAGFVLEGDKCETFDPKKGKKNDNCIANVEYDKDKTKENKCMECKETFGIIDSDLTCKPYPSNTCKKGFLGYCIEATDDKNIAVNKANIDIHKPPYTDVTAKPASGFTEIANCSVYSHDLKKCGVCKTNFGFNTQYECVEDKDNNDPDKDKGLSGLAIFFIIAGSIAGVALVGFVVYTFCIKNKKTVSKTPLV